MKKMFQMIIRWIFSPIVIPSLILIGHLRWAGGIHKDITYLFIWEVVIDWITGRDL